MLASAHISLLLHVQPSGDEAVESAGSERDKIELREEHVLLSFLQRGACTLSCILIHFEKTCLTYVIGMLLD